MKAKAAKPTLGPPVHPFPARMAPRIAQRKLAERKSCTVLDPMMGSGTTLAMARLHGHRAIGFDVDPLAVLLTRAWCSDAAAADVRAAGRRVLASARRRARALRDAYPIGADGPMQAYVRYWFDRRSRIELAALSGAIASTRNDALRTLLWCALSRLVITKDAGVSLARDISHSRPHRAFEVAPVRPFAAFAPAVERVLAGLAPRSSGPKPKPVRATQGDARHLPLRARSVDIVITSPPYLNALDYMRGHRLALVWMGRGLTELRGIRAESVGTESGLPDDELAKELRPALRALAATKLDSRHAGMLRRYVRDMNDVISEIARVVRRGGSVVLVVGDSTLRGVPVRNSRAIRKLAERHGLRLARRTTRVIPENRRYLPPPKAMLPANELGRRMHREVVLEFEKAAA